MIPGQERIIEINDDGGPEDERSLVIDHKDIKFHIEGDMSSDSPNIRMKKKKTKLNSSGKRDQDKHKNRYSTNDNYLTAQEEKESKKVQQLII
jgi:hypothetical protein